MRNKVTVPVVRFSPLAGLLDAAYLEGEPGIHDLFAAVVDAMAPKPAMGRAPLMGV